MSGLIAALVVTFAAGCGGDGGSTRPDSRGVTGTLTLTSDGGTTTRSGEFPPKKTTPGECVDRWNRAGVDPDLNHVLIPIARVSGPFAAQVGISAGNPEIVPPGICIVIVRAEAEGAQGARYTTTQSSPHDRFVRSPVGNARTLLGRGELTPATLERNGSLRLGG